MSEIENMKAVRIHNYGGPEVLSFEDAPRPGPGSAEVLIRAHAAAKVSQGLRGSFWLQGMLAGHKGVIDCIKAFSEADFTEDLKKFDVPTLVLHGDDDQIVPIGASALLSSKIVKGATLKIYPGAPHGMCSTLKDQVNAELLAFLKRSDQAAA